MGRIGLIALLTVAGLGAWTGFVAGEMVYGWTRAPLAERGDSRAFFDAAAAKIDAENRGNAAFVLMEDGAVVGRRFQSRGAPVDADSLFQVASLSKWVTAFGVMTLVEAGKLDLDAPVSTYLTRWRLPDSPYNDQVTVRRLLSHTAGLTDGLGYAGFPPGTAVQSLEESLTKASDASPDADGRVLVGVEPGTVWRYSGGGYTLLQLVVEEVSGEAFDSYMKRAVFQPLGMTGSTYVIDEQSSARVAAFFDTDGNPATHYAFTATAAASLYTSVADMVRFLEAHITGPAGEPPGRSVLRPQTLEAMRSPEARQYGFPIWGLGAILYAPNDSGGFVIGHDGSNEPAVNATARLDPDSGDGVIVLLTGARRLATDIGSEWVFWKVGEADLFTVQRNAPAAFKRFSVGAAVILALAICLILFGRRRRAAK